MIKYKQLASVYLAAMLAICTPLITSPVVFATNVPTTTYTVKHGDCLYSIAKKHGMSLNTLRQANNKYNDSISPCQVLNIKADKISTVHNSTSAAINYTASDVDLLSRLISAEARGEPYSAQVSVGAVVVNRVKSSLFPNTISAVIYQTVNGCYQFTPVLDGNIKKPAQASSIKAAYEALAGNDPTNKSLFFYDYLATDAWIKAQPVSMKIDKLIFAY